MFGESRSESPRLPSPWQQAVASAQVILTPVALSSDSKGDDIGPLDFSRRRRMSSGRTYTPRTSSGLSLTASISSHVPEPGSGRLCTAIEAASPNISRAVTPSRSIESFSDVSRSHSRSTGTGTSSFTDDPDMHARLWADGLSENLILSPGPESVGSIILAGGLSLPPKLVAERDRAGHIEYKFKLMAPTQERFERLTTQLKWRLTEGGGEAMYEIGVLDDGTLVGITRSEMEQSLRILELMAAELGATVMVLRTISLTAPGAPAAGATDDKRSPGDSNGLIKGATKAEATLKATREARKLAKIKKYLNRTPEELEQDRQERIAYSAKKKARHAARADVEDRQHENGGITNGMPRKKWRGHDWADDEDEQEGTGDQRASHGFNATERSAGSFVLGEASLDNSGVHSGPLQDRVENENTQHLQPARKEAPKRASWQQRNLDRAYQEWSRKDERDLTRDNDARPSLSAHRKRRRKPWREKGITPALDERPSHSDANVSGSDGSESDPSEESRPSEEESNGATEMDGELFAFDEGLDMPPGSTGSGQPLTAEALDGISARGIDPEQTVKSYLGMTGAIHTRNEALPYKYQLPVKKRVKKRYNKQPKPGRSERRRMDLLRGDGVTADGDFLFNEDEDSRDSIFMLGSGVSPEGGPDDGVQGVLDRLMGLTIPEQSASKSDLPVAGSAERAVLSSSPSTTLQPSSPPPLGMIHVMQDDNPAGLDPMPSQAPTITMPLDTMSLSFSRAQTAVGTGDVPESDDEDEGRHDVKLDQASLQVGSLDLRLCVEAIVIKKMETEDRFSFFGFDG